jgi:hypothetical protein
LLNLAARLPFEEAAEIAQGWGVRVSRAELERLSAKYSQSLEEGVKQHLEAMAQQPLEENEQPPRVMVLEIDGVRVSGQPDPSTHQCEGIEIKAALVYAHNAPSERTRIAGEMNPQQLLPRLSGLLRESGVRVQDCLIGVSDGAIWIEQLYETLGIPQIIDVFHSSQYLDQIMVQLGWSETERNYERTLWLAGQISATQWLKTFCPPPTAPQRLSWTQEAQTAIQYLEQRANRMNYPDYKTKGWPIGSGQIEGMNKHVIGSRMKRSGMHWSRPGASRMAALRAETCAKRRMLDFHTLRHRAFPFPYF